MPDQDAASRKKVARKRSRTPATPPPECFSGAELWYDKVHLSHSCLLVDLRQWFTPLYKEARMSGDVDFVENFRLQASDEAYLQRHAIPHFVVEYYLWYVLVWVLRELYKCDPATEPDPWYHCVRAKMQSLRNRQIAAISRVDSLTRLPDQRYEDNDEVCRRLPLHVDGDYERNYRFESDTERNYLFDTVEMLSIIEKVYLSQ